MRKIFKYTNQKLIKGYVLLLKRTQGYRNGLSLSGVKLQQGSRRSLSMLVRSRVFCSVPLVEDIKAVMLLLHDLFFGPYQGPSSLWNEAGDVQNEDVDRWWLSNDVKAVLAGVDFTARVRFRLYSKAYLPDVIEEKKVVDQD